MPVVGVASKLRQPAVGSKPIHTALPIPNPGRSSMAHGLAPRSSELRVTESSMLSCQLSFKTEIHDRRSTLVPAPSATLARSSRQAEESKICKVSETYDPGIHPCVPCLGWSLDQVLVRPTGGSHIALEECWPWFLFD